MTVYTRPYIVTDPTRNCFSFSEVRFCLSKQCRFIAFHLGLHCLPKAYFGLLLFFSRVLSRRNYACADPERFVRGGPTLTFFKLMRGGANYRNKRAIIDPPAAFRWRADDDTTLNAGLVLL